MPDRSTGGPPVLLVDDDPVLLVSGVALAPRTSRSPRSGTAGGDPVPRYAAGRRGGDRPVDAEPSVGCSRPRGASPLLPASPKTGRNESTSRWRPGRRLRLPLKPVEPARFVCIRRAGAWSLQARSTPLGALSGRPERLRLGRSTQSRRCWPPSGIEAIAASFHPVLLTGRRGPKELVSGDSPAGAGRWSRERGG
jgi:hypothetical protein